MADNITAFIDGTGQIYDQPKPTNIVKLCDRFEGVKKYWPGPGTGILIDKILGGLFGSGVYQRSREVVKWIVEEHEKNPDAKIRIFGYSRGATVGRDVGSKLGVMGITVEFVGFIDTVGAMGIHINIWPLTWFGIRNQEIDLFLDLEVHENVKRAAHVLALDEKRPAFVATRMKERQDIVEKGFSGDHGYVGSATETLDWIWSQYQETG